MKRVLEVGLVVASLLVSSVAFAASAPKVGDPIASVVPKGDQVPQGGTVCRATTVLLSAVLDDSDSFVGAVFLVDGDVRVVMVGDTLYGDRTGDGVITDIGHIDDKVFGANICAYVKKFE